MSLIQCPYCGHTVSDKATRCPNCGDPLTPVDSGAQPTAQPTNPQPSKTPAAKPPTPKSSGNGGALAIIFIGVAVIAIAVIAYFAFVHDKHGSEDSTWDYPEETAVVEETEAADDYDGTFNANLTEDELEAAIESANSEMPQIIEEGMRMDEIRLDGNYVTYVCTIDEAIYSISDIRNSHAEVKRTMLNNLKNTTDNDIKSFVALCKSHNKGIAYRYVGDETGNAHTIYIGASEL